MMDDPIDLQTLITALEAPLGWTAMGRGQFQHQVGLTLWLVPNPQEHQAFEVKIQRRRAQLYTYNAFRLPHLSQDTTYRVLGPLQVAHTDIDGETFGHAMTQQWGAWQKLHALMAVLRRHFGVGRWQGGSVERFFTPEGWAWCPRLAPNHLSMLLHKHHLCWLTPDATWEIPTSLAWTRGGSSSAEDQAWALQTLLEGSL